MILINGILGILFLVCYAYQLFYMLIALFGKGRPHTADNITYHKFAVMISARNEEQVIGELIDSINRQDYPSEYIQVFLVADNCTDRTADIAREHGAVVYERFDTKQVGKGYALDFLLGHIDHDYPHNTFDAFFVFDADNVLSPDYITEMNKTYCDGYLALTSYRNSKNFGDNWISAGYALWFLREAKYLNNARMMLGSSCAISGTGFMLDRSLLEDEDGHFGWKYYLLTEDIEFTASNIVKGEKIGYCGTAEFYDEQPVTFKQSWNQRLRWAKGYLQVFRDYGRELLLGIFGRIQRGNENTAKREKASRFSCFDMSMTIMPAMILTGLMCAVDIVGAIIMLLVFKDPQSALKLISMPIIEASVLVFIVGIVTTATEWRKIHTSTPKKLLYTLTFPIFMLTYIPIAIVAVFSRRVEWKPISHSKSVTLEDIHSAGKCRNESDDHLKFVEEDNEIM